MENSQLTCEKKKVHTWLFHIVLYCGSRPGSWKIKMAHKIEKIKKLLVLKSWCFFCKVGGFSWSLGALRVGLIWCCNFLIITWVWILEISLVLDSSNPDWQSKVPVKIGTKPKKTFDLNQELSIKMRISKVNTLCLNSMFNDLTLARYGTTGMCVHSLVVLCKQKEPVRADGEADSLGRVITCLVERSPHIPYR